MIESTEGELALDIASLRGKTGLITLDPGFINTGPPQRDLYVDGENGSAPLSGHSDRTARPEVELCGDQLSADLRPPTEQAELDTFQARVIANAPLHESFKHHFEGFPVDAPPMAMLSAMVNTLSCFHPKIQSSSDADFDEEAAWLLSKTPTIAAYSYRRSMGMPFIYPDPRLSYAGDFLHMMFSQPWTSISPHRRSSTP